MSGSSIGTIAGGLIGGILGFFVPVVGIAIGFAVGSAVGGAIGGFIDAPKTPELIGPRLTDLSIQTSTYGAFIPRAYGKIGVYGNIFWIENNKIKETSKKVRQGGKGIGGGGATTKTYTYSATFALGLCEGPIAGVNKIWIGSKLFYSASATDVYEIIASNQHTPYFRVYLGTEDQLADPRIQATLGVANVPAYRGLAYIVFYDLPLADYGNSLASTQIKIEIIHSATVSSIINNITSVNSASFPMRPVISGNYLYLPCKTAFKAIVFSIADPANPVQVSTIEFAFSSVNSIVISATTLFLSTDSANRVYKYSIANPLAPVQLGFAVLSSGTGAVSVVMDDNYVYAAHANFVDVITPGALLVYTTLTFSSATLQLYISGDLLFVSQATKVKIHLSLTEISEITGIIGHARQMCVYMNHLYLATASGLLIYNISDPEFPSFVYNFSSLGSITAIQIVDHYAYVASYPDGVSVLNVLDPTTPELLCSSGLAPRATSLAVGNLIYFTDQVTSISLNVAQFVVTAFFDETETLGEIVESECLNSKFLTVADIDTTELTDIVRGYRISELGAIRGGVDPLRTAWPFDAIQSGYQIYFKRRGSASVATIDSSLLDARAAGSKDGVIISQSREMDSVLHRKVLIKYFDVTREYDVNEQYVERINTDAVNESIIDLPIVLNANEAAQKAEVLLYLYWMERNDLVFSLPPTYSQLEPGDVITITGDNADHEVRLTGVNSLSDGRLECKAKYNKATIYSPVALGEEGQSTGVTATLSGPSTYELLDIPLIQTVYDEPGFVLAMTGYLTGWPGGVLYKSTDNGQTFEDVQAVGPPGATMGIASTTIGVHGGTVLDKTRLLTVRMIQGDLSSVTQSQMFDGQNWFAYGADGRWEIIACQNAVLQGNGDYILSDFLRGQMGTEWATGLHAVGDIIVHLNSDELEFIPVDSSTITASYIYRGITDEDTIDSDSDKAFSYDAVNLECLSPCQETGSRHPTTNDWTITWTRRTRFAGWRSYIDAELGEDIESYEIDVFSSAAFTTIKRTLTSTNQTVQYTSAQQITDFGSNQSTIRVKIYQMSALVGRGYALTATLTRT